MDTKALKGIAVRADFSNDELELLEQVEEGGGAEFARALTLVYASRLLKDAVDSHRAATYELTQEIRKQRGRLTWFTVALVLVAAALASLAFRAGP